ncbi:hypothetical protein [Spirosoma flavum]|uniref:Uncharacterized protein n=1 Tax=Spirosoma flavum TaxID=2048557 RepID=A0ABW6AM49_9BACT
MTTQELEALEPGTVIYIPTDWEVTIWQYAGKIPFRNWYTLLNAPDQDGVTDNRRPVYIDALHLLPATLDEQAAWLDVVKTLEERKQWIYKRKLIETV